MIRFLYSASYASRESADRAQVEFVAYAGVNGRAATGCTPYTSHGCSSL